MASYIYVVSVISIFFFSTAFCAYTDEGPFVPEFFPTSHNIYDCINPTVNKTLLYSSVINERPRLLSYITRTVSFPSNSINSNIITCIVVTDNEDDDRGGYASIQSGGVSSYSVEIRLRSQWSRGLSFNVRIYTDS